MKTWTLVIDRLEKLFSSLSDDELQTEVAPGRNRAYYLLGHLAAYHDRLLPMLGLGERLHPELDDIFIVNPDRSFPDEILAPELRKMFTKINTTLTSLIQALPPAELLKRHEAVSEEDFAKDPLRNRIAVFEVRTAHAMFHAGQLRLITKP
jgi:hypothetical protein